LKRKKNATFGEPVKMIISTSDTHLSRTIYVGLPGMTGDSYNSFDQVCQYAVDRKASTLLLAGDVFDGQPDPQDVRCFLSNVEKLKRAHVKVYAIQGQHGYNQHLSWASIDDYVVNLNRKVVKLEEGVVCAGFDTLPPAELRAELAKLDARVNLLVLHQLARGTVPEVEGHQSWDFDPDWVPGHVKLVLLGDYHDTWQYKRGSKDSI
jgi:DNA repair exonuclease SbcCD nuclease subunit